MTHTASGPPGLADELGWLADALAGVSEALETSQRLLATTEPRAVAPTGAGAALGDAVHALTRRLAHAAADTGDGGQALRARVTPDDAGPPGDEETRQ